MSMNRTLPPRMAAEQSDFNLHELGNVFRRHRRLIAGCLLVGSASGVALARSIAPVYEASAVVRVEDRPAGLPALDALARLNTTSQIATEVEVLRSRKLAGAVVDSLGLQLRIVKPRVQASRVFSLVEVAEQVDTARYRLVPQPTGRVELVDARSGSPLGGAERGGRLPLDGALLVLAPGAAEHGEIEFEIRPRDAAVDELLAGLTVRQPNREANIIRVEYRGKDPHLVRDVPNLLADRFVDSRRGVQSAELRSTAEFLRQQLDTLAVQLAAAERELQAFRERGQVINLQVEGSTQVSRLAGMQADRSVLAAEHVALTQLLQEVQAATAGAPPVAGASSYRRLIAFPSLIRNQTAAELLRSLTRLEDERATLLSRRRDTDPEVLVLTTRVRELEEELRALVSTYQAGLGNQLASMDASLAGFQRQLAAIPAKEVEFARLSRQPQVLAEMHAHLQTRLKEAEIAQAVNDNRVRIVDLAVLPTAPSGTTKRLILGFGVVFGFLVGVGASFVKEYRDGTVRSRSDALAATGTPVLGLIPRLPLPEVSWHRRLLPRAGKQLPPAGGMQLRVASAPRALQAQQIATTAYQRLHVNLLFTQGHTEAKTLLVTSALPGDGKTTTTINLALSLAQQGLRVLLIDADLRRPTVHTALRSERTPGLTDVLAGTVQLDAAVQVREVPGGAPLHFLAAGELPDQPLQVLQGARFTALLRFLREGYDRIVVDSPPLNVVPDAAALSAHVEGVLLVARAGVTPFEALVFAQEQLRDANAPAVGVVLNDIDVNRDATYDGAYRWYEYGKAYHAETAR